MNRPRITALAIAMLLLLGVASASRGQDLDVTKAPEKQRADAKPLLRPGAVKAAPRVAVLQLAHPAKRSSMVTLMRGNISLKGETFRLRNEVLLYLPEESEVAQIELDDDPEDELEAGPPLRVPAGPNLFSYLVAEENFDLYVFGRGFGPIERRDRLAEALQARLNQANQANHLSDKEAAKLRLAGRGDVNRYLGSVEVRRREFLASNTDFIHGLRALTSLNDLTDAFHEGPFGEGSLFVKMLARILADRPQNSASKDQP